MSIILRQNKGSELTFSEVDGNFSSLYYSSSLAGNVINFFFTGSTPPLSQSIDLSTMPGIGGVQVYYTGSQVNYAQSLFFIGGGVDVTPLPNGGVTINIPEGDSAGGSDTEVQFAKEVLGNTELSGSNNFTFDYNSNALKLTGSIDINGTDPLTIDTLTERADLFTVATYDTSTKKIQYRTLPGAGGISGTSGTSGTAGSSGTSGTSGASGTSGTSGEIGSSGESGTSGISGTSGESGSSGINGTSGFTGSSGTSGKSGTNGTFGSNGQSGKMVQQVLQVLVVL